MVRRNNFVRGVLLCALALTGSILTGCHGGGGCSSGSSGDGGFDAYSPPDTSTPGGGDGGGDSGGGDNGGGDGGGGGDVPDPGGGNVAHPHHALTPEQVLRQL